MKDFEFGICNCVVFFWSMCARVYLSLFAVACGATRWEGAALIELGMSITAAATGLPRCALSARVTIKVTNPK